MNIVNMLDKFLTPIKADVNILGGLEAAQNNFMLQIKPIVNAIIVPVICLALTIYLLFLISGAVTKKKQGMEYSDKVVPIVIVILGLIVVGSAPVWLWMMAGI